MRLLITGGCGFIGSNFIRYILNHYSGYEVVNLDALTYAGNVDNLKGVDESLYRFIHADIGNGAVVAQALKGVDAVVHFAAESHVDRSIENSAPFLHTNVLALQVLLEEARKAGTRRFVHISTDEVYGSLETDEGLFTESTPLNPNSPYSASKAAGDLLVRSYMVTFGFPAIILRPSNNYGPYQFPEKLIPLMVTNLIEGKPVPVYAQGKNIRDWLFVEDNCRAIDLVLHQGRIGEIYNIGGEGERRNIDIVKSVLALMGMDESVIRYVADRPGHDYRYGLDNGKITAQLGWKPQVTVEEGLKETVRWYRENAWWWKPLKGGGAPKRNP